jgi:homogentisate 1,2-dioxygenase
MPHYMRLGDVPAKRHTRYSRDPQKSYKGEGLAYEHVITTEGFDRAYSILYHLRPPTRVRHVELLRHRPLQKAVETPLRHHHFHTNQLRRHGDLYTGRTPLLFNSDVVCYRSRPEKAYGAYEYFRNAGADEIIFVYEGGGTLETVYGWQPYRKEDYIVIPRGTTYRLVPDDPTKEDHLVLESASPVRIPERYLNPDGQIRLGAPYSERDFHGPVELNTVDLEGDVEILVKDGPRLTRMVMAHHPFDLVAWDGFLYPFTFNAADFEPVTGTIHQPPPVHQTFELKGYVVCTFAPRYLDHHPDAIKVPYVHDNTEADEVLFYVRGNFGSRRGVESGSMTLHPRGIPHGPHPGTIMASMEATRTEELAVMFDTAQPLELTEDAVAIDDPAYPKSWLD